jgi:hypothetical protein
MSEKTPAVTIRDAGPMDRVQLRLLVLTQPSPLVASRLKIFQPTKSYCSVGALRCKISQSFISASLIRVENT